MLSFTVLPGLPLTPQRTAINNEGIDAMMAGLTQNDTETF